MLLLQIIAIPHVPNQPVLYRNNDSALPLIDLLEQKGVPYACRQREGFFFTSPLVRDITDMLEFAFAARTPAAPGATPRGSRRCSGPRPPP